jgi:2-amino-4-hydroxy-6-hydroxymethyldihydropteridine diphosphokinase
MGGGAWSVRGAREVFLGLGSNLGDREANLARALARLGSLVSGLQVAPVYETEPLDGAGPGLFLNTVVRGWTTLEAAALLAKTSEIEADLGRLREPGDPRRPRTMDIDVLLLADTVRDDAHLTLPHPRMCGRLFVLLPLLDLAPALADPRTGRAYRSALPLVPPQGVRRLAAERG